MNKNIRSSTHTHFVTSQSTVVKQLKTTHKDINKPILTLTFFFNNFNFVNGGE